MWVAGLTVYPTLGRVVFVLYYLFLFSSHNFLDKNIFYAAALCHSNAVCTAYSTKQYVAGYKCSVKHVRWKGFFLSLLQVRLITVVRS